MPVELSLRIAEATDFEWPEMDFSIRAGLMNAPFRIGLGWQVLQNLVFIMYTS